MKSVGKAALGMVKEVRRQIRENPGILEGLSEPDYKACVKISTLASLKEMILPGLMVKSFSLLRSL
jgi:Na+/H+-translocating membrane pyrophosphatase